MGYLLALRVNKTSILSQRRRSCPTANRLNIDSPTIPPEFLTQHEELLTRQINLPVSYISLIIHNFSQAVFLLTFHFRCYSFVKARYIDLGVPSQTLQINHYTVWKMER